MIPPTGGRETDPELDQSPEPEEQAADYSPSAAASYSPRIKIFVFGVLAGWLVAIAYAFIHAVLMIIALTPGFDTPFSGAPRTLFASFVTVLLSAAPWFIMAATIAAAAEAIIRRSHRDARATRDALRGVKRGSEAPAAPAGRRASEIVEPFRRERDMELDPSPHKEQ
jgi:hypothetical protein